MLGRAYVPCFSILLPGCDALFTNDYSFPKPKFNTKRTSDPDTFGEEVPTPPGVPSPMARWVNNALTGPCAKHSHKVQGGAMMMRHVFGSMACF